jgi:hypothetical protein
MKKLKSKIEAMEKVSRVSNYLPVLFLDDENEIHSYSHLIGPETVVIIDDIS